MASASQGQRGVISCLDDSESLLAILVRAAAATFRRAQGQRRVHLLGQDDLRRRAAERTRDRHAAPESRRSFHFGLGVRVSARQLANAS